MSGENRTDRRERERERDAGAFFQAGETDCEASCPVRSGGASTHDRPMYDRSDTWGTGFYVARTWRTSPSDSSGSMYESSCNS